ncbi:hypothetical protein QFZ75_001230 [Streptomyces sp. V3I8]|nr:hypothetical protein [Streptomyces sp. V3I8]
MGIATFGFGGMSGASYAALTLTKVSGYPTSAVAWLLVLFDIGLMVGNALGGRPVDRALAAPWQSHSWACWPCRFSSMHPSRHGDPGRPSRRPHREKHGDG